MTKKDLKYFMRENKEEVITVPGPESFKDSDGNVIQLEIKVLPNKRIQEINELHQKRVVATDKNGKPIISVNNEVAFKVTKDNQKVSNHMILESLVYPDLRDKELMDYYNCIDALEMPMLVFSRPDEFAYINKILLQVLGLSADFDDKDDVEEAKN